MEAEPDSDKQTLGSTEVPRQSPSEQEYPFILNLFFCFIFPFVCRIAPINDEAMPATPRKDCSRDTLKTFGPCLTKVFDQYNPDQNEQQLGVPPDQTVRKPIRSLVKDIFQELITFEDVLSWLCILCAFASPLFC